jgi:hypothetical protein
VARAVSGGHGRRGERQGSGGAQDDGAPMREPHAEILPRGRAGVGEEDEKI